MSEIEATLKLLSQYGAPLFITAGLLWFLFTRVPKWFDKSNDAQDRVAKAVETQSETQKEHCRLMKGVLTHSQLVSDAGYLVLDAAAKVAENAAKSKYDIPSDVVDKIKEAKAILSPSRRGHSGPSED